MASALRALGHRPRDPVIFDTRHNSFGVMRRSDASSLGSGGDALVAGLLETNCLVSQGMRRGRRIHPAATRRRHYFDHQSRICGSGRTELQL